MSETKHTSVSWSEPGAYPPIVIKEHGQEVGRIRRFEILGGPERRTVAIVHGRRDATFEEDVAYAYLVSSAPDLLSVAVFAEAVASLADRNCGDPLSDGGRCNECLGCGRDLLYWMSQAAIAKAHGEALP